jgi:lipopolysaccharide/colanic/teichoic acid biosynthesis glycosyltransferase
MGELELVGNTPAILVRVTPLIGSAKITKRISDIVFGGLLLLLALIPMAVIWIIEKLTDPSASPASTAASRFTSSAP